MDYVNRTTQSGNVIKLKDYKKRVKRNRRNRRIVLCIFLMACLVCFALFAPFFKILNITVSGNKKIPMEEIVSASQISLDYNIYRTSLGKAKKNISALPYVNKVNIKRKFPNKIEISVEESVISAYIPYENTYIYIDSFGKVLEQNEITPKSNVPLIENAELQSFEPGKNFISANPHKFEFIVAIMQEIVHNNIGGIVTLINIPDTDNLSIVLNNRLEIIIGNNDNLPYKVSFLAINAYKNLGEKSRGVLDVSSGTKGIYKENK